MIAAPTDHGIVNRADRMRVGQGNRTRERPGFLDPGRAGHFTATVQGKPGGGHDPFSQGSAGLSISRPDGRHTGPNRMLTITGNQRGHADLNAGNIGDRIERSSHARKGNAKVTGSRFAH
jgi:hypothetical protein